MVAPTPRQIPRSIRRSQGYRRPSATCEPTSGVPMIPRPLHFCNGVGGREKRTQFSRLKVKRHAITLSPNGEGHTRSNMYKALLCVLAYYVS